MTINLCLLYTCDVKKGLSNGDGTRIVPNAQTAPECHLPDQHLSLMRPISFIQNPEVTDLLTAQKQKVSEVNLVNRRNCFSAKSTWAYSLGPICQRTIYQLEYTPSLTASTDDQVSKLKSKHS
jgi:hypothetical protein